MKSEIEAAIKALLTRITHDVKSDDALKFTQAAQNLANTAACLNNIKS